MISLVSILSLWLRSEQTRVRSRCPRSLWDWGAGAARVNLGLFPSSALLAGAAS